MFSSKKILLRKHSNLNSVSQYLIYLGIIVFGASLGFLLIVFFPVIQNELSYSLTRPLASKTNVVEPKSVDFGVVIPKIGANSRVVANVDPFTESAYQQALTRGIAHARGTAYPGTTGTTFLFSHSSVNFYQATRYNSVFYLLDKLTNGDEIFAYYKGEKYRYRVTQKRVVNAEDVAYLQNTNNGKQLILMTCWPAGTNLKRLLIIASITPDS